MNGAQRVVCFYVSLPLLVGETIQQGEELLVLKLIELGDDDHCVLHKKSSFVPVKNAGIYVHIIARREGKRTVQFS